MNLGVATGAAVHVEVAGDGSPVVLLHGWAMHSGLWGTLAKDLAARHRVFCVDLPGHGYSAPLDPFTIDGAVLAIERAIPAGRAPLTLLGWSFGALIAMR